MDKQWEIAWKDYYRVLQVDERAESEVIEGAYRKLAQKYHPDRTGNADPQRIKLINEAHEILGNPGKRREYDRAYRARKDRRTPETPSQASLLRQTAQELFENAEETRKLAREADKKFIQSHEEVEKAWKTFRDLEKRLNEFCNAVGLARKTFQSLQEEAAEAGKKVTEARHSVREAEKTEQDAWKEAKKIWKKAGEAQAEERKAWKALEEVKQQALDAERTAIEAMRWTEDIRRRTGQVQADLRDPRVQKEIKRAEKNEAEARDRAVKARKKVSFFEEKQLRALETAREWTRKVEEAERRRTEIQQAAEAARQLVVEAERRENEARKAVEEARRRVTEAEAREGETQHAMEESRHRVTEVERIERESRQVLDAARRRAEEALRKSEEARKKAFEARKKAEEAQNRMDAAKARETSPAGTYVCDPVVAAEDERKILEQHPHAFSMRFHRTFTFGFGLFTVGAEIGGFRTGRTRAGQSRIDRGAYDVETRSGHWQIGWASLRRLRPDFVVTLKAKKKQGDDGQAFGLVFRSIDSKDDASSQTWHFFSLRARGEAGYHRLDANKDRVLKGLRGVPCPSLRPGDAVNELRVVWRKDRGHLFVNGDYLISISGLPDRDLQMGTLALGGGRVRITGLDLLCRICPRRRRSFFRTAQWGRVKASPDVGAPMS